MTGVRRLLRRVIALFRPDRAESDLAREVNAHLQLLEDQFVAKGQTRDEARYAARRAFGGVEQAKEQQRDARSFRWLAGWSMDLKLGARMLIKSPGLTVVAVIALAVAMSAGAAYFEFFNDFFRPTLPFQGGDRLVGIVIFDAAKNDVEGRTTYEFTQWRDRLRTIEGLGAARNIDQNLTTEDGRVEPVRGSAISASVFRVIPIAPLAGRPLTTDDERPGAPDVVVIGHDVWRARFNSDADVVGRVVKLGDRPHTIVGVMPEGFGFPINDTLWTPLRVEASAASRGEGPDIKIFGRLAPGAGLDAAQAELNAIAAAAPDAAAHPLLRPHVRPYVESLWFRPNMLWQVKILYGINLLFIGLLGICGANVATLVFARTVTREAEITVRTALGASRGRIVSQLIAEALVLTALAAIVGLVGASALLHRVRDIWVAAQGEPMPFWWTAQIGGETILYAALLAVLAALLVGGVPAFKATGARIQGRLKQAGAAGSTMRLGRLWTGVIVAQVAVTVVFLLSVVSIAWDFAVVRQQFFDVIFPRHEYLSARVAMDPGATRARQKAALQEFLRRAAPNSSVASVTYATHLPGMGWEGFRLEAGTVASAGGDSPWVESARIGANYFETFNIPLVAGRGFTLAEIEFGRNVAIVDETFVRLVMGGRRAVGQMVRQPPKAASEPPGPWFEIVGVVKDTSSAPKKKTWNAMLYRPFAPDDESPVRIVVHARGDAAALGTPLRAAAAAADPDLRLYDVLTLDRVAETEVMTMDSLVQGMGIIGAVALLLSTAGIYSLISFTLARRTRETGIRMALGAAPRRIITGILSKAMLQIGLGIVLGSIPGLAIIAYGLEDDSGGRGPWTSLGVTVGVAVFVLTVAAAACSVPLRRALRIEPTQALRSDA